MEIDYDFEEPENAGPTFSSYAPYSQKLQIVLLQRGASVGNKFS